MKTLLKPAPNEGPGANHAGKLAALTVSAAARQHAREADAAMTNDEWKYTPPGLTTTAPLPPESLYFLP